MINKLFIILSICYYVSATNHRHYYITAEEIDWNYAPTGTNMAGEPSQMFFDKTERRMDRIGSVYRKVVYRGYTDGSFTKPLPRHPSEGLLGPTIKAEVGDKIYIHFRNLARKRGFGVHPHGVFYNKQHEGALYLDGTGPNGKYDDYVPPGGQFTYEWIAHEMHGPTKDDDNCNAWGYHSHTQAHDDIDTGLIGLLVICRPGILAMDGRRMDVDRELVVYSDIADENHNWYIDDNINRCGNPVLCRRLKEKKDRSFVQSNMKYHINGFMYGNLPDFHVCEGERVAWYFMSLNLGIHTIHVNGQTMVIEKKRLTQTKGVNITKMILSKSNIIWVPSSDGTSTDTAALKPATFLTGHMIPMNPGRWLLYCRNQFHFTRGMQAFVNVKVCNKKFPPVHKIKPQGRFRKYFLAIEEILWDYAPKFKTNKRSAFKFLAKGPNRIGSVYKKAVYREYTDETFKTPKPRGEHEMHYGLAGPPIAAEVGDHVVVVVMNKASRPYSFLANGVSITKKNEGAFYKQSPKAPFSSGKVIAPGSAAMYKFYVPENSSPMPLDPHCLTYVYHSAVDVSRDIYSGLFGPLLVCKHGTLTLGGYQKGVDREFFLNWMVIDENLSWYIDQNIGAFIKNPLAVNKDDQAFQTSNRMRAINGRTYGSLKGLHMCMGAKVLWHMYGLGERFDHHNFVFEGNTIVHEGSRKDFSSVFPGTGETVMMQPDHTGQHLLRTGQLSHEYEGLYAVYNVMMCPKHKMPVLMPSMRANGVVRRYFIAAIETNWDYCPNKISHINGRSLFNPQMSGYPFVRNDPEFVGSIYKKAIYRGFTDATFSRMLPRGPEQQHLGILGPFIKGNVGDTIEIMFKNKASFPYNIVPRNLIFADGSPISGAPPTGPGEIMIYSYVIPERSGPLLNEPNCIGSSYSSRVHPRNDTYSGLFGPLVICKPGILNLHGYRTDGVTKEFAMGFSIIDENLSNYKNFNFRTRAPARRNISNTEFVESNHYYSINGLIYANLKGFVFHQGEKTAWYIFGLGSSTGIHTVHFHGQLYLRKTDLGLKRDVLEVFSGTHETIEMLGYNPGTWIVHCHVSIHAARGMSTMFTVLPHPSTMHPPPPHGHHGIGKKDVHHEHGFVPFMSTPPLITGHGPMIPNHTPMPPMMKPTPHMPYHPGHFRLPPTPPMPMIF